MITYKGWRTAAMMPVASGVIFGAAITPGAQQARPAAVSLNPAPFAAHYVSAEQALADLPSHTPESAYRDHLPPYPISSTAPATRANLRGLGQDLLGSPLLSEPTYGYTWRLGDTGLLEITTSSAGRLVFRSLPSEKPLSVSGSFLHAGLHGGGE